MLKYRICSSSVEPFWKIGNQLVEDLHAVSLLESVISNSFHVKEKQRINAIEAEKSTMAVWPSQYGEPNNVHSNNAKP
jgi:hypothetical protein